MKDTTFRHLCEVLKNRREAGFTRDDDAKAVARLVGAAVDLIKNARALGTNQRGSVNKLGAAVCAYNGDHDFGGVEEILDHDGHGRHQVVRKCVLCGSESVAREPCDCEGPSSDELPRGTVDRLIRGY
jgi:hypothetical protein